MTVKELTKNITRFIARIIFDRSCKKKITVKSKHILFINWNGMIGDATISSPLISSIKTLSNLKVHVITTKELSELYLNDYKVDSVYVIKKNFSIIDLVIASKSLRFCDTIIPLIGRLQWRDILFAGLIKPIHFLSVDNDLNLSNLDIDYNKDSTSVDEFFRLLAKRINPKLECNSPYTIPYSDKEVSENNFILVNPFASRPDKSLSVAKSAELLSFLSKNIPDKKFIILHSPKTINDAIQITNIVSHSNIAIANNIEKINDTIPYLNKCDALLSVDTSIVHLAYGLQKQIVAIYPTTDYFNAWIPPKNDRTQIIFSNAKIINRVKNMNEFDDFEVLMCINRTCNYKKLSDGNNVFLYFNKPFNEMPLSHRMNVKNFLYRESQSNYRVILTNLDKSSSLYIENFVKLPDYFFDLENKTDDVESINGNQSDIIRLLLLQKYGGCYFDTSTILLKNSVSEISLYNSLKQSETSTLAGYTNVTFTRKTPGNSNFFADAKDGLELGLLFAKKNSNLIKLLIDEIGNYWRWKTKNKYYKDYPPFVKARLRQVSFLNEYHIHYSIYHMLISVEPNLLTQVITESIHMSGKENAVKNGPNTLTDRFCRGSDGYGSACPSKIQKCFSDDILSSYNGERTTLQERSDLLKSMELISIPGYLRKKLEMIYTKEDDYFLQNSLYSRIYNLKMLTYQPYDKIE